MRSTKGNGERTFTRVFDGRQVHVTLRVSDLRATVDINRDASWVSGTIGLVGELIAEAVEAEAQADADYHAWRASRTKIAIAELVKPNEIRIKSEVEADHAFLDHKYKIAGCDGDLEYLRAYHDALRVLSSMTRARVELARGQYDAESSGFGSGEREEAHAAPVMGRRGQEDRDARMADAMARKRTNTPTGE